MAGQNSFPSDARPLQALLQPSSIAVVGASADPRSFGGFVLGNLRRFGYAGALHLVSRSSDDIDGLRCVRTVAELPDALDLAVLAIPETGVLDALQTLAGKGCRAAVLFASGYAETGDEGRGRQEVLAALARDSGMLLLGPNCMGFTNYQHAVPLTFEALAPNPAAGQPGIGVLAQSGAMAANLRDAFLGRGLVVPCVCSTGNEASVTVEDVLAHYLADAQIRVVALYAEQIRRPQLFLRLARQARAAGKPIVLLMPGRSARAREAAASHTGALASDDRVFDGVCRQAGAIRAASIEEAFETAATFATQPRLTGNRVAVLTTAGGWGVVTADAIHRSDLELLALPDDLRAAIDEKLPPRWSRNNPIDFAGAETRDTIPEVLDLVTAHPEVDAVVMLGLGIQSNQARLMRTGAFYPDHGLERIVAYHERQDARFAQAAAEASARTGKPVLIATELAYADPDNAGPRTVRETGRLCYLSSERAVRALEHVWHDARHRARRAGS